LTEDVFVAELCRNAVSQFNVLCGLRLKKVACGAFSSLQPVGQLYPCPQ